MGARIVSKQQSHIPLLHCFTPKLPLLLLHDLRNINYHWYFPGQDVLLFIDNIFRFTQAGSEVSALLGRIPSAVGYQPTLATDMGSMQERITTTKKGSITSVQVCQVVGLSSSGCALPSVHKRLIKTKITTCLGNLCAGRRFDGPCPCDDIRPSGCHHGVVTWHR